MNLIDIHAVDRMLRTDFIGRNLVYLSETKSTMDDARVEAETGASHGTVVMAEEQTKGRGRFGRRWVSPAGLNLYLTVVLRPDAKRLRQLAMTAPLAICLAAEEVTPVQTGIKWPNDVQVGARKLAGVLIENEFSGAEPKYALVGIGLNVNDPIAHPDIAQVATSLARETGRDIPREAALAALLNEFEELYERGDVFAAWRERIVTLGQDVRLTFRDEAYEGHAEDVMDDGALILRLPDGTHMTFEAGEVTLRA
ncbi:MAG TPA: biotin--[acetyl-CoA-carboxylase] ligase [Dehalococcoidia bacterium]|nr:biotin--[acetyl-CoA-carboxylase] ligase [Dehalococcoidia bacterium]